MSNPQNVRTVADSPEAAPGATTTFVRADPRPSAEGYADLHPQLRAQLRELQLRTGTATPDVGLLLRLVNEDRKSTRLNSSHGYISYAVFCLKKKKYRIVGSTLCRRKARVLCHLHTSGDDLS